VIGNPPYVRLEDVPPTRTAAYRQACPTMTGRSDVYVGFIERGLRLLGENGTLGFIVADRWMHNQYGADLRRLVSEEFSVEVVLEMHCTDAFEERVSAYPAITIIRNRPQRMAVLASASKEFGPVGATRFAHWTKSSTVPTRRSSGFSGARLPGWFRGSELWPAGDPEAVAVVRSIEERFPPLEDLRTGTRVRIGVATGSDEVFLTSDANVVEPERLLPLVMSEDIASGEVQWNGTYLVNPWTESGLVHIEDFPLLKTHYNKHRRQLEGRHIAKVRPASWYRTIDRVWPELVNQPKLLLPDVRASIHPVLETGGLYPHHNLYFVTSTYWDLEVLGGLLYSDIADLFVGTYCVKMRGGYYRFQAQYLRKICVPSIGSLTATHRRSLRRAFATRDVEQATAVSMRLFGLHELPASVRRR
jgi:adenine-specific DNA-methyltransferase